MKPVASPESAPCPPRTFLTALIPWRSPADLDGYRHNLQFAFFNTVTWQVALTTPLVIFAQQLGASASQLGLLASLVLLLTPLQIVSTALLPRVGYKRLMLAGWGWRSLLLIVPVALAVSAGWQGPQPWMAHALLGTILVFCLFRSLGLAAMVPWFYAIIPAEIRGRYFSRESAMLGIASVLILVVSAVSFAVMPIFPALALQFACAAAASGLSWRALHALPDAPPPAPASVSTLLRAAPGLLTKPSDFRRYFALSLLVGAITSPIPSFVPFYLKGTGELSASGVMALEIVRYLTMVYAAHLIGRKIDHVGARPYLLAVPAFAALFGGYWLLHLHGWGLGLVGLLVAYVLLGLMNTAWNVGNAHYLPKVAPAEHHALMLALHGAGVALASGLSTVLWGRLLQPAEGGGGIAPAWFAGLFVTLLAGSALMSRVLAARPEPQADAAEPLHVINTVLRPWRAALYLINLAEPVPRVTPPADRVNRLSS